jgi:AmmeMemoRadiSam system protein B
MTDPLQHPKIRWPLDVRLERLENEQALIINCPLGVSSRPLLIKPAFAPLIAQFEGKLSVDEIASHFKGIGAERELVLRLARLLDEHLFLDTPRFHAANQEFRDAYGEALVRPAALAGLSYSASREELARHVDAFLAEGTHGAAPQLAPQNSAVSHLSNPLLGLVAPHIDYRRGGCCYGRIYSKLRGARHDLYLLLGTAHQYSTHLFHLTKKDFESPLGTLSCDRDFCQALADRYGSKRSFADEILHRKEHSLELQLPFLQQVTSLPRIVPILIGGFHKYIAAQRAPEHYDEYESFVASLAETYRNATSAGKSICLIAGVDMAHVGQNFGDKEPLSKDAMKHIEVRDQQYLDAVVRQDKHALFAHIAEDADQRRMCGFPTLYTTIDLFNRLGLTYRAEVVDYRQAVDFETDCAVTFAGITLHAAQS